MAMPVTQALDTTIEVDIGAATETMTLREYFKGLLLKVWEEAEGFSGKRPWGDSNWQGHLERACHEAGITEGTADDWGDINYADPTFYFDDYIAECINAL